MIDTSTWKEFCVGDLFSLERGKCSKVAGLNDGDTPYVGCTNRNNGVLGYYDFDNNLISKGHCIVFIGNGNGSAGQQIYKEEDFVSSTGNVMGYRDNLNEYNAGFIISVMDKIQEVTQEFSHANGRTLDKLAEQIILLPATSGGQPDWDYMEAYMKAVMEESEKSLEILKKANDTKHLIDVSGWGEFRLKDLFTKRTMKGYPKKAESYDEVENGYHIFGQNIGYQYPYKVLMDEQYLHIVESDKPILAYASSVCEIGLINESFYRSGDNGAFQGLFPVGYHPNLLQMQFVLVILKKEFEKFRYDTSMQDTMQIKFKLPVTLTGEPNWQYMEDYMKSIMDKSEQIINNLQIGA